MSVLLGSEVSELARERAKLPTCLGGLGIRVAQMGFAAQATLWSAVDLHKAVMTNVCEALNKPKREPHPEVATALAAKTDLLLSGVAVVSEKRLRTKPASCARRARGQRISELQRSFARLLCRRLTASRRRASLGTWRSPSCNRGDCQLRRRCRLRSYTAKCLPEQQAVMLSAGGPGSGTCWTAMHKSPTELAQKAQWRMATALRLGATPDAGPRSTRAPDMCQQSLATHPFHSSLLQARESQKWTAPRGPVHRAPCP